MQLKTVKLLAGLEFVDTLLLNSSPLGVKTNPLLSTMKDRETLRLWQNGLESKHRISNILIMFALILRKHTINTAKAEVIFF
jgi:hypothetical protein